MLAAQTGHHNARYLINDSDITGAGESDVVRLHWSNQ